MALETDMIVDRRRLRRKLGLWRLAAALSAILAVVALGALAVGWNTTLTGATPHVARVSIEGVIRTDRQRARLLEEIADSGARAVIVHIDSVGGTVSGAEELYTSLRRLGERKPVVAVLGSVATSGGYIAAMGADRIISRGGSMVGSVGVLVQYPNVTGLLDRLGVRIEDVRSSPLKAAPSGYGETSPEARAALEALVRDSYAWFRGLVRDRRQIDGAALDRVADGRVFTGRQGIEMGLVDQIGDERTARDWLAERGIDRSLPVRDWRRRERLQDLGFLRGTAVAVLEAAGLDTLARILGDSGLAGAIERVNLDGLLVVWHPPGNE